MIKCGIVGGTGYTGAELIRLLISHPEAQIEVITSRSEAGTAVDAYFPNLRGRIDIGYTAPDPDRLGACDLVFFATPNGTAMNMVPQLLERGVKVIDLAADFRLPDPNVWEQWYGMPHTCPHILEEAVYGLPEINRERIRSARVVANPGCYPTAVILGMLPLLEQGIVDPESLIADAKSGVSGAGRKASVPILLAECSESFKAYNVQGHRHWPEIKGVLEGVAARALGFTFVPHLLPMIRGIHATLYANLTADADLQALYEQRYAGEAFVDVMPALSHPETRSVKGANLCRIAVHRPQDGRRVVVLSVIDNLIKGASGQAVQNMNLMFGLPETLGLDAIPISP